MIILSLYMFISIFIIYLSFINEPYKARSHSAKHFHCRFMNTSVCLFYKNPSVRNQNIHNSTSAPRGFSLLQGFLICYSVRNMLRDRAFSDSACSAVSEVQVSHPGSAFLYGMPSWQPLPEQLRYAQPLLHPYPR